jgi:hypothetical protein
MNKQEVFEFKKLLLDTIKNGLDIGEHKHIKDYLEVLFSATLIANGKLAKREGIRVMFDGRNLNKFLNEFSKYEVILTSKDGADYVDMHFTLADFEAEEIVTILLWGDTNKPRNEERVVHKFPVVGECIVPLLKEIDLYEARISTVADNKKLISRILNLDYISTYRENKSPHIGMLLRGSSGLYIQDMPLKSEPMNEYNYSRDVVGTYKYIKEQFSSDCPNGRLAIFSGIPGTGKTYLIKGLLNDLCKSGAKPLFIPSKLAGSIDDPSMLPLLFGHRAEGRPIILVIEDADLCLEKRNGSNIAVISSLLNYTDGIVGTALDVRVIATTNLKNLELDDAVTRSGRLLVHSKVGLLSTKLANKCLENLGCKEKVHEPKTLADLYALSNGSAAAIKKEETTVRRVGF